MDLGDTWGKLGEANYLLLPPAVAIYFGAVYFRTLRWQYLLSPIKSLALVRLYPVVVVGYMANNLLPLRLGEVVRAYYVGDREKISKMSALATIAVERVLDGLTLLFILAVVSMFLPIVGLLQGIGDRAGIAWVPIALAMSTPFVVIAAVMILASYSPPWLEVVVYRVSGAMPALVRVKLRELFHQFIGGLEVLKSPRHLLAVFILSLPVWLLEALMYYILALSFHMDQLFSVTEMAGVILFVTSISNLATSLPAAGGGIGTFEVAATLTLTILGVDIDTASAYTIVVHSALLVPVTLLGLIYIWIDKVTLVQLTRGSRVQDTQITHVSQEVELKVEDSP